MDEGTALLIVGGILSFMGVLMNINPIKFDEDLMGALEGELTDRENMLRNFGAQLRTVIGAFAITIGIIAIYRMKIRVTDDNPDSQFIPLPQTITPLGMELNPTTEPIEEPIKDESKNT